VMTCQIESFNSCFQAFKEGCCINDGSCGQTATGVGPIGAFEQKCDAAISSETCSDVMNGVVPAACLMSA